VTVRPRSQTPQELHQGRIVSPTPCRRGGDSELRQAVSMRAFVSPNATLVFDIELLSVS
jgi:hypothetical protein